MNILESKNKENLVSSDSGPEYFCDDCPMLLVSEKGQQRLKAVFGVDTQHMCLRHEVRLFHGGYHPHILPCSKCKEDMNKNN